MLSKKTGIPFSALILCCILSAGQQSDTGQTDTIRTAAEQTEFYFPLLKGKNCAITTNHTAVIGKVHLVDSLVNAGIAVKKIFSPEHGYRGIAADGVVIQNSRDDKTGISIVSLYGKRKKPLPSDLQGIDLMIFDIQDVGVRFYTYISTLQYVMEACTENHIPLIVLDRPNPLGHYVDGPVLEHGFKSFVGMDPVPVVYGLTIGELAGMINGEGWLTKGVRCDLTVIPCSGYTHKSRYILPLNPSPNLQSMVAVYLYPSVALFEGTIMNVGRGTPFSYQVFGHPEFPVKEFSYVPRISAKNPDPKHKEQVCYGIDLRTLTTDYLSQNNRINLSWLINAYKTMNRSDFFIAFIDKLAGTDSLRKQIEAGWSEEQIRKSWEPGLEKFRQLSKKYLLYPE
ncbi:MAG: DUF1343 domain-containing protein [Bacteroidales bacterium]|nr:DUF1343 domain-containing protein [Bacteroidales bacterium]